MASSLLFQQAPFAICGRNSRFFFPCKTSLFYCTSHRTILQRLIIRSAYNNDTKVFTSDRKQIDHLTDITSFPTFVFSTKCLANSKDIALTDGVSGGELTFGALEEHMFRLASGLQKMGIQQGDVVMILSPNSIYYPVAFLAIAYCGGVVATPNPLGTVEDVHHQVRLANVKLVITTPELLFKVQLLNLPTILIDWDCDDNGVNEQRVQDIVLLTKILEYSSPKVKRIKIQTDDPAAVLYSSGTTGMSKAVVLSHANIIAQIMQLTIAEYPDQRQISDNHSHNQAEVHLCALPMSHIFGSVVVTLQQIYRGNPTVIVRGFELNGLLAAIQRFQISHIYVVPPVVISLTKNLQKNSSKYDLSSLRSILCGAAPLGKEIIDVCFHLFPKISFFQIYGLTEVTGALTLNSTANVNPSSVGTMLSNMEAKVVDVETGEPLPPNHQGELLVRGPTTMIGYMNDPKATNCTLNPPGWLRTGDLVYFDEHGNLYVVDRIKELIKYKALQVAPAELEALLLSHPNILDAAVVPYNVKDVGEVPMAFVVLSLDGNLTEDDVKSFVAKHVAPYKRVRRVAFTNAIPKTASGKILRKELVKQAL